MVAVNSYQLKARHVFPQHSFLETHTNSKHKQRFNFQKKIIQVVLHSEFKICLLFVTCKRINID